MESNNNNIVLMNNKASKLFCAYSKLKQKTNEHVHHAYNNTPYACMMAQIANISDNRKKENDMVAVPFSLFIWHM